MDTTGSDEADRARSGTIRFYKTGTQMSGGPFPVSEAPDDPVPVDVGPVSVGGCFDEAAGTSAKIDAEGAAPPVLKGSIRHVGTGNSVPRAGLSWWGNRRRRTEALPVLRFAVTSGPRPDRRRTPDYPLSPGAGFLERVRSAIMCVPPLPVSEAHVTRIPLPLGNRRERRENRHRPGRRKAPVPPSLQEGA